MNFTFISKRQMTEAEKAFQFNPDVSSEAVDVADQCYTDMLHHWIPGMMAGNATFDELSRALVMRIERSFEKSPMKARSKMQVMLTLAVIAGYFIARSGWLEKLQKAKG